MTDPTEPVKYTRTEMCPKCGAGDPTASFNTGTNQLELRCLRCAYLWTAKPLDTVE